MRWLTSHRRWHLGRAYLRLVHAVVSVISLGERLQAGVQDFNVDFSARHGCACFRESNFGLKQFVF